MARKPIGQDEKDRIGQAEMDARRAEERGEPAAEPVTDENLDSLTRDELVAEAAARGIDVRSGVTKPQIIEVLREHPERVGAEPVEEG